MFTMKKVICALVILIFTLPLSALSKELNFDLSVEPARVIVVPFENATGDPYLDWIAWGLQDAMTVDLLYIKGFEAMTLFDSYQSTTFTLPYTIRDSYFNKAKKIDKDELIRMSSGPDQLLRQIWVGKYQGNPENMIVEISVLHARSGKVLATKQIKTPLETLLKEASKAVLELAKKLGVVVSKEEKARVLSPKTASVDAWRLNAEGFMYENEYEERSSFIHDESDDKLNALLGKWRKALKWSVAADPNYAEARVNLGRFNNHYANKQRESGNSFGKALSIKPFLIHASSGMTDISYLKKTVALNPSLSIYTDRLLHSIKNTQGEKEALHLGFKLLKSRSPSTRCIAILHLQRIGDKKTIIPLFAELVKDPDRDVRRIAVYALGQAGGKAAVPALIQALNDQDRFVRMAATSAFKEINDKTAIPALLKALKDPEISYDAAWALEKIADKTIIPAMLEELKAPEEHVRAGAAGILGKVGGKTEVPALIEALKDPDRSVRWRAADALGTIGDRTAVPHLIQALKDPDDLVRHFSINALGEIGDPAAVPSLIEILQTDVDADWYAIRALGWIGDKIAVPALIEVVKNSSKYDRNKRTSAIESLAKIGDKRAVPVLIEALKEAESRVRSSSAGALGTLKDETAVPALIEALKDPSWDVGGAAAKALGKISGARLAMSLIEWLKNPKEYMRRHAASALGETGDKAAVPALIEALKDQSDSVRSAAVEALGKIEDTRAVPALVEVYSHDKGFGTALALGKLGDGTGMPLLIKDLESNSWSYGNHNRDVLRVLAEQGKASALYNAFAKNFGVNLYIFDQIRKNYWFPESFDVLIKSNDSFVRSTGYYLLALKAREEGRYKDQIEQINNALKQIDPEDKTAFTVLCLWLKTQAQLKLNKQKDAVETIKKAEELLGYISKEEWMQYQELFEEYTLFLKGEVNSARKDNKTAVKAYEEALEKVEKNKKDYSIGMGEFAHKLEAMVRTSLGALQIKMGKENLEKAVETGRNYQANDSVEMENEEKRYLELCRQKIGEGDYEAAQKLMEELNLRRTNYINRRTKINLADKEKQATIEEYRKKQEEIESITRKIEALAMSKKDEKAGAASQGGDEIKTLETEKNNKRRELQVYLTGLKKTHPDIAALLGAKPLELAAIQEQLPENTAILQYLMLPDKLVVFIIKKAGIDIIETPAKKAELKDKVEALRKAIFSRSTGKDSKRIHPLSAELHTLLIKPLEDSRKLKGVTVLGIAPNGFLHQLPFGVLMNSSNQYLIDRYTLFFMNSTSLLGVALEREKQKTKGASTLLAISNPDGTLPAADTEVADISKLFDKKQVYSQKQATKNIIQAGKKDHSILHLSTHGIFNPVDSTKSYLVMADGRLTLEDIWGLPLSGTSLTVLSACESGIGEVLSGDDVVSLENAFIYAGSPTVIATLWKVADQSTAELMTLFYRNLTDGKTRAGALTAAQRELRKNYDHPFFWAAVTLRGEWR